MVHGTCHRLYGMLCTVCMMYVVRCTVYGVWCTGHGVWCMARGVRHGTAGMYEFMYMQKGMHVPT